MLFGFLLCEEAVEVDEDAGRRLLVDEAGVTDFLLAGVLALLLLLLSVGFEGITEKKLVIFFRSEVAYFNALGQIGSMGSS